MKRKMTELYCKGQRKLMDVKERFLREEKGASHMVEIVVVIVIVIAVAAVFNKAIGDAVKEIMDRLTTFVENNNPTT